MRRVGIPPRVDKLDKLATNDWFETCTEKLNIYHGASDPTVAEVPENQWIIYRNDTLPEVRIWTNIAGTLKKSAAFT